MKGKRANLSCAELSKRSQENRVQSNTESSRRQNLPRVPQLIALTRDDRNSQPLDLPPCCRLLTLTGAISRKYVYWQTPTLPSRCCLRTLEPGPDRRTPLLTESRTRICSSWDLILLRSAALCCASKGLFQDLGPLTQSLRRDYVICAVRADPFKESCPLPGPLI
jgi:hypothetical protein